MAFFSIIVHLLSVEWELVLVSKKIQIDKERGKKIGETEVAKNLLEVGIPIDVIQQTTGLQDLKAI